MKILQELYGKIVEFQNSINYDARLGEIWMQNLPTMLSLINNYETIEETIANVDRTFMYAINFPPENASLGTGVWDNNDDVPIVRDYLVDWLLADQKRNGIDIFSMPEYIQETPFIYDRNKVIRNDRILSGNFLRTLSMYCRIQKFIKEPINTVLELGAGAGYQARTFLLLKPDTKYFIFDLPETLCFSYAQLSATFPEKKCIYVTSPSELATVDDYDIVCVPVVFADSLRGRSYDLFINTASLGEMTNKTISYWVDYIQSSVTNMFVANRFLNTVNDCMDRGMQRYESNACSLLFDDKWEILNWEVEPSYARCPYIDPLHSRYLEIIARRPWDIGDEEKKALADKLFTDVRFEDWYRLENKFHMGIMTARDNVLVTDTTMTGALFKLWESIRLDRNHNNVSLMVKYIKLLTHDNPMFRPEPDRRYYPDKAPEPKYMEELSYYQNLL